MARLRWTKLWTAVNNLFLWNMIHVIQFLHSVGCPVQLTLTQRSWRRWSWVADMQGRQPVQYRILHAGPHSQSDIIRERSAKEDLRSNYITTVWEYTRGTSGLIEVFWDNHSENMFNTWAPPTSTRTAKLVRWVLEQLTVTVFPSLVTLSVLSPSDDHLTLWDPVFLHTWRKSIVYELCAGGCNGS